MTERLRLYRAEPGPPTAPKGVLFGRDAQMRSRFVLVDRRTALEVRDQLYATGGPVVYWTREAQVLR